MADPVEIVSREDLSQLLTAGDEDELHRLLSAVDAGGDAFPLGETSGGFAIPDGFAALGPLDPLLISNHAIVA